MSNDNDISPNSKRLFRSSSERYNNISDYLGRVRNMSQADVIEAGDASPETVYARHEVYDPIASNTYSKNLTSRMPEISSNARAFPPITGKPVCFDGHIMPGDRINKQAAEKSGLSKWVNNAGKTTLVDIHKAWNKATVNPLVQSAMLAGITGLGMYGLAPTFNKALLTASGDTPTINRRTGEVEWISPEDRRNTALWTGGLTFLGNLARHVNWSKPSWSDLTMFKGASAGGLSKLASMLGPVDYVPKSFAMNAVTMDPNIPDYLKYNTLNVLGNIGGGEDAMINSTDMVSSGISSGLSGRTGFPLGRIAASATADALLAYGVGSLAGIPSPGKLARNVGIGSAALRGLGNLL